MTREQLIDECMILFVAGHETSANALTWTMLELSRRPDLRTELVEHVRNRKEAQKSVHSITTHLMNEALRKYPPAWLIDRVAKGDDKIGTLKIQKGTVFLLYVYGVHHHENYWENPTKFYPARFADREKDTPYKDAFYPFGAGPRLCIGNHFAMLEMQLIIETFVKHFPDFHLASEMPDLQPMITLRPKGKALLNLNSSKI